jgi:hypothetical protein
VYLTNIKSAIPHSLKRAIKRGLEFQRVRTGLIRLMPDFVIIGAQRCGTTTLYNYLKRHPYCVPAPGKEVHFFDINFEKGTTWYRTHFPSFLYKCYVEQIRRQDLVVGEASPYYVFHPHAARRILETVSSVKLILLLRNPVDRAYSHYHHEIRWGYENLSSFEEAIEREEQRLYGEVEKMLADENYYSFNHHHYSYLLRGIYIDQLEAWMDFFPKEQILILKSEDFYNDPPTVFKRVIEFLNLSSWEPEGYRNYNYASNPKMDATTRERLIDYFKPHNQRLYEYLGMNLGWDR